MNRLIPLILVFLTTAVNAGTSDKVASWFNNMNYSNVTSGGVYEAQGARYYTAGGVSARAPITSAPQLATVQTPKFSAGCAGIDWYSGGFSTINADEFVQHLRAIGQNAQALAFMLAIQIVSPQLSSVMENIQDWANKYLKMGQDSCSTAMALIGGGMEMMGQREGNCIVKRMQERGENWETAKHRCGTGGAVHSTESSGDPNVVTFVKGNIAWYALMEDAYFRNDTEFAELMMNLIGTIIVGNDGTGADSPMTRVEIVPAISAEGETERFRNIYNAILFGRDAADPLRIRRCHGGAVNSKDACLQLTDLEDVVPDWDGLVIRIQNMITSISDKARDDAVLSGAEKGLIASSRLPLYRYINTASIYQDSGMIAEQLKKQSLLIAQDIVLKAVASTLDRIDQGVGNMAGNKADVEIVRIFRDQVRSGQGELNRMARENLREMDNFYEMRKRIADYEREVMARLGGGYVQAASWGR